MGEDAPGRGFRAVRPLPPVAGVPRDLAVEIETGEEVEVTQFAHAGDVPSAFREIAERHAAIGHPLVAPVLGFTEPAGGDLDAPLLVEGHEVGPRLSEAGPLDRERALGLGADVADALAALHADGLVHGGLAADAVVLAGDGRPRVVGAGVAALQAAALGGPAPSARDDDLRALGAILYELLCGVPPGEEPRAPIELVPELPPALNGLVLSLLSTDPHRPPPPAAAVSLRLRELADDLATALPRTAEPAAGAVAPVAAVRRGRLRSAAALAPVAIDGPVALAAAFLALAGILAAYGISRGHERAAGAVTLRLTHTVTLAAETLTLTAPVVPTAPTTASVPTFDTSTTGFPTTTSDTTLTPGGATTVFSTETVVSTVNVGTTVAVTRTTVPARTYTYTFSTVISTPRRTSTTVQGQTTITTPRG
jgi:serine/threonine-protein kinase